MRTTLDIDDGLLVEARAAAARERTSLTRFIEEALTLRLRSARTAPAAPLPELPVFHGGTGLAPGIDPLSNRSLYAASDEEDDRKSGRRH